jgi:hypothetical protein
MRGAQEPAHARSRRGCGITLVADHQTRWLSKAVAIGSPVQTLPFRA